MKGCCEMRGRGWEMFSWETGSADACHRASVAGRGRPLALRRRHWVFLERRRLHRRAVSLSRLQGTIIYTTPELLPWSGRSRLLFLFLLLHLWPRLHQGWRFSQEGFNIHPLFCIQGKGGTSALPLWVQKWLQRFVQDRNWANFFLLILD